METRFRREMAALSGVLAMSHEFCRLNGVDDGNRDTIDFVLEELFTNAVKYGVQADDEILITLDRVGDEIRLSITDFDADRFDIREAAEVDVEQPLEARTPGGLGIHLVRKLADRIEYDYADRIGTTIVHRRLE